jgi:hypothetical protein
MKRGPHFQPPRQSVVYGYTRRMLDETATNANSFAMELAAQYIATVAPDVRTVALKLGEGDDLIRALKANGQILRRYMDGTVKTLPADLEDAWVMALPEPYRSDCERDLAQRRGRYSMCQLDPTESGQVVGLGELMKEVGQLCEALAPAVADGVINRKDLPHARKILDTSDDVIAAVLSMRRRITDLLDTEGTPHA